MATLLENRPDYVLHKLALNSIGVCCVPINPEYRAGEIAYLLEHSEPELGAIALPARRQQLIDALAESTHRPHHRPGGVCLGCPTVAAASPGRCAETPASILYTSGTTGRPKGCVLSQGYEVATGVRYVAFGGLADAAPGTGPHLQSAAALSCQRRCLLADGRHSHRQLPDPADRFRPQRWWREIAETRATVVHYLGIIVPLLLGQAASEESAHQVRFAVGAGVEPELHRPEARFGFPLIEVWGMTEMLRVLADTSNRAMSAPAPSAAPSRVSRRVSSTTQAASSRVATPANC